MWYTISAKIAQYSLCYHCCTRVIILQILHIFPWRHSCIFVCILYVSDDQRPITLMIVSLSTQYLTNDTLHPTMNDTHFILWHSYLSAAFSISPLISQGWLGPFGGADPPYSYWTEFHLSSYLWLLLRTTVQALRCFKTNKLLMMKSLLDESWT